MINQDIKAVLFDMDGVLVDAKSWHYDAFNDALNFYSFSSISKIDHLNIYDGLSTKGKLKLNPETANLSDELIDQINDKKQEYTRQMIEDKCVINPTLISLIKKLKNDGYKVGCCSNSIRNSIDMMLEKVGVLDYFDLILSNEDVVNPKPASDIYLKAINDLKIKSHETLICEDSLKGIKAALHSGAFIVKIGTIKDTDISSIYYALKQVKHGNLMNTIINLPIRTGKIDEMVKGWFAGDFYPSILKTKDFEAGVKYYKAGDMEEVHHHKIGTEVTFIAKGKVIMCEKVIDEGEMILMEPNISTSFKALEDTITFVVKTPSILGDKY